MLNTFWVHQKKRENEKFYQNALVKLCILMTENELTFWDAHAMRLGMALSKEAGDKIMKYHFLK